VFRETRGGGTTREYEARGTDGVSMAKGILLGVLSVCVGGVRRWALVALNVNGRTVEVSMG
jgi:hypothetical protein